MIRPRPVYHLENPEHAEQLIYAVGETFDVRWLSQDGPHRIKSVWARRDPLASTELVCFGNALVRVRDLAPEWLKKTVRRIRKTPADAHGLISEILTFGQLSVPDGSLELAVDSQAGFDAIAHHGNGWRHFISVKNHDISDKEKQFQQAGRRIRKAWQNRIGLERRSGGVVVISQVPFEAHHEAAIIELLKCEPAPIGTRLLFDEAIYVSWGGPYDHIQPLSTARLSDHVVVVATQPTSEQDRFKTGLRKAIQRIEKHTPNDPNTCRIVHMRVHESADLVLLETLANELAAHPDYGVDGVFLLQPSVVHDAAKSQVLHTVRMGGTGRKFIEFAQSRAGSHTTPYTYQFGAGALSDKPSQIQLRAPLGSGITLSPHSYVFQQGDYYVDATPGKDGAVEANISTPAPGIAVHAVFRIQGGEFVLQPLSPESDLLHLL
jgi:hypothetical protein